LVIKFFIKFAVSTGEANARSPHGLDEGKRQGRLASSRQCGNALLTSPIKKKRMRISVYKLICDVGLGGGGVSSSNVSVSA